MSVWIETPFVPSEPLARAAGRPVWLKLENTQPSGSFKLRGMGHACERAVQRGATQLVSSSGGNAGYAVAWAGRRLGVSVTVVVPRRTSPTMRARIEAEGAAVVVHGEVWDDAHAHAQTLPGVLVHPFDHPDCWEGHASLVHEMARQGPRPGLIVVAVGGGGLLTGVLQGMDAVGWSDVPVLAMETHGTASLGAAMKAGRPVTLPGIEGVALTLGARQVCDEAFEAVGRHKVAVRSVSDAAAVDAVGRFLDDHRMLVEPACGAALAPVYAGDVEGEGPVAVIVCGGAGATREALAGWQAAVAP